MAKKREENEVFMPLPNGGHIHGTFLRAKDPKRVVLISPLAGSDSVEQLYTFRIMTRKNCELFSFEYRGHGQSTGVFTLENSLEDTQCALDWIIQYGIERDLPVHAHSTCYGLITLLKCFENIPQDHERYRNVRSINAVSGLPSLHRVLKTSDFLERYNANGYSPVSEAEFLSLLSERDIDLQDRRFLLSLKEYLREKLPGLVVEDDHFGKLYYPRVDMHRVLSTFTRGIPLDGVALPSSIPAHFFYGIHDEILQVKTPEGLSTYKEAVHKIVPHAIIESMDMDHFGRGNHHQRVIDAVSDACIRADQAYA